MSWGERSCKHIDCPIPDECTMETCNVNCREYLWDGKTNPDTVNKEEAGKRMNNFNRMKKKLITNKQWRRKQKGK